LEKLLTTDEAAALLNKPAGTLVQWRYTRQGPPYVKLGNAVRYRLRDLDAWVKANTVTPAKQPA
jgi:excisionase family DNA binding protein